MQLGRVTGGKILGTGLQICTSHVQPSSNVDAYSPSISKAIFVECKIALIARPRSESCHHNATVHELLYTCLTSSTSHQLKRFEFATETKRGHPQNQRGPFTLSGEWKGASTSPSGTGGIRPLAISN